MMCMMYARDVQAQPRRGLPGCGSPNGRSELAQSQLAPSTVSLPHTHLLKGLSRSIRNFYVMPSSTENVQQQLQELATYLTAQRDTILDAWRQRVQSDPKLEDVSQWTRSQFHDHIPFVLESFGNRLAAWPDEAPLEHKEREKEPVDAHSRHRWQQGYNLRSLVREWGHLNECLVEAFHCFAAQHPSIAETVLQEAHRAWARMFNEYVTENVVEYSRLVQTEAATRASELEQAIGHLHQLAEERGEVLRTATHDLRGRLSVVLGSASMMEEQSLLPEDRAEFRRLFQSGFGALSGMLTDLMSMARLEAGQEKRKVAPFDASHLLSLLCSGSQHLARESGLYLRWHGPDTLPVEGDAMQVQRIAQNLLLNGLKYTQAGGVSVSWGPVDDSSDRWELCVEDTGPGMKSGTAAPLARTLETATEAAHDVEGVTLHAPTGKTNGSSNPQGVSDGISTSKAASKPGEGVGLAIVKRLCELLNASIELQTTEGVGSRFRIVFPQKYED